MRQRKEKRLSTPYKSQSHCIVDLDNSRRATLSPTADLPDPIMPTKYKLEPPSRGPNNRAGSIFIPSSPFPCSIKALFLKGFSTPESKASAGSCHSKPPASRNVVVVRNVLVVVLATEKAVVITGACSDTKHSSSAATNSEEDEDILFIAMAKDNDVDEGTGKIPWGD